MKIIVFNDPHKSARPPVSRKDGYNDCINKKLAEIKKFAWDYEVDFVCCTGDLFITKDPSKIPYWLTNEWISFWASVGPEKILAIGNHDCQDIVNIKNYPVWTLQQGGGIYCNYISGVVTDAKVSETERGMILGVINFDVGRDVEKMREKLAEIQKAAASRISIVIAHASIVPQHLFQNYPDPFLTKCIDAEKIAGFVDYLFYGDIHDDMGTYEIKGTKFCNFGSIARNVAIELKRDRDVSFAYLDTADGNIQRVVLEDVQPADEVFKTVEIAETTAFDEDVEHFVESLDKTEFAVLTPDVMRLKIDASTELNDKEKKLAKETIDNVSG